MHSQNLDRDSIEVESEKDALELTVTEGDQLTYIHIRKVAHIGLIAETKAQYLRISEMEKDKLIRVRTLKYPKVITQDCKIVPYVYTSDLDSLKIQYVGLVNNWIMNPKVSVDLIEAAAKKFGVTYKKIIDSAYRFDDTADIEQRQKEMLESERLSVFRYIVEESPSEND